MFVTVRADQYMCLQSKTTVLTENKHKEKLPALLPPDRQNLTALIINVIDQQLIDTITFRLALTNNQWCHLFSRRFKSLLVQLLKCENFLLSAWCCKKKKRQLMLLLFSKQQSQTYWLVLNLPIKYFYRTETRFSLSVSSQKQQQKLVCGNLGWTDSDQCFFFFLKL